MGGLKREVIPELQEFSRHVLACISSATFAAQNMIARAVHCHRHSAALEIERQLVHAPAKGRNVNSPAKSSAGRSIAMTAPP
jgi:hypothetical protein